MSSALRPLLTATAAGTVLCALWFVPSANASPDSPVGDAPPANPASLITERTGAGSDATSASLENTGQDVRLADTGSFDTTPYVIGGTVFLALGAGFVVYSVRRERLEF